MTNNTTPPSSMLSFFARKRGGGHYSFTIFELIAAIILIGVLVAAVTMVTTQTKMQITNVTVVDQVVADIQYVQMLSLENRSNRSIVFTSGSSTYTIMDNTNGVIKTHKLPPDAAAGTTVTFTFNSLGELTGGINLTLSLGGNTITVYRITGKVVVS